MKGPTLRRTTFGAFMRAAAKVHESGAQIDDYPHEAWMFHWGPLLIIAPRSRRAWK